MHPLCAVDSMAARSHGVPEPNDNKWRSPVKAAGPALILNTLRHTPLVKS